MGSLLVAFVLLAGDFNVQATAVSETRAGEAPIVPGADPRAFVAEILTPVVGFELREPDLVFSGWYGPRIFWEDPNPIGVSGPLILHTSQLTLEGRLSPRVTIRATAAGSIGKPDYATLPQVLGTVQGSLPPIVDLASAEGQVKLGIALSQRWQIDLLAHAFYWRWLDIPSTLTAGTITGQKLVSGEPDLLFRVTPRDALGLGVAVADAAYSGGIGVVTISSEAIWKRRLTLQTDLDLRAGLVYAEARGTTPAGSPPLLGSSGREVAPIGSVNVDSRVTHYQGVIVHSVVGSGVDFFVDPVLDTATPRALFEGGVTAISPGIWELGLRGDFATALRTSPYPVVAGASPPDETAFSLTLSLRRLYSENFLGEVGLRWADRAPAFVTPDGQFHQRQVWAYLAISATTRPFLRQVDKRVQ